MNIPEAIKSIMKSELKPTILTGKVVSVDTTTMSCEIDLLTQPKIYNVRIRSVIDEVAKGLLIVPKINSIVTIALIDGKITSSSIIAYSEVESIKWICDDIQLNGDSNGGLVKVEQLTEKLNAIENALNGLVSDFNTHVHNAPQAPSGTIPTLPPLVGSTQVLQTTQTIELESKKVQHGE